MPTSLRRAVAATFILSCLTLSAQEKGYWRAASKTAQSITGDVSLADEKISINFANFPMIRARALEPAEITVLFNTDSPAPNSGSLYRLDIPSTKKFLRRNTLCGSEDVIWMATYTAGRELQLAFFSGQRPPLLTQEALNNSTDLCGTYAYVK